MKKIGVIVGSFKEGSLSVKVALNVKELFPKDYDLQFIEIADLPIYTEDYDNGKLTQPKAYQRFRQEMAEIDALVFVTPEHNRTIPAVLKNALDIGSRPYGASVWGGKPALVISQSPGNLSGFGANHHLRQVLTFLDIYPLQQPEVYLGGTYQMFDENGKISNPESVKFLQSVVDQFVEFSKKFI